jgi:DNA-binding NarL/FixJ family response regulator
MSNLIHLIIAHEHCLFRQCLASALGADPQFSIVDAGVNEELLPRIREHGADVVLIALTPRCNALDLTRMINQRFPHVKIILLDMPETRQAFLECIEAGAQSYVPTDGTLDDVTGAISSVLRDEAMCPPQFTLSLFDRLANLARESHQDGVPEFSPLTFRQLEIVRLIADGLSNKQIARQLRLSLFTVKNHIHNILTILEVEDRWEAVERAHQNRWVRKLNA